MKRGLFITLEGGEGVGKSTNLSFIKNLLAKKSLTVITTREPGGTVFAEKIRHLLLEKGEENVSEQAELLLVFAARAQHIHQLIQPALSKGHWVLSDRFTDATFAYQGGGRQMDLSMIECLENQVQGKLRPDLTLLLDAPLEIAMTRMKKRAKLDRFESEKQNFFEKVRASYLQRARQYPQRIKIINAGESLIQVQDQISLVIENFVKNNG